MVITKPKHYDRDLQATDRGQNAKDQNRGRGHGFETKAETAVTILALRPLWLRGLNIFRFYLQVVISYMGSHYVACQPTKMNAPRFNPSQTGRCSIYLSRRDGRLS